MSRINETKNVLYIFTDILEAKEIEVQKLSVNKLSRGKMLRVPTINGHVKEYYIDHIDVQINLSQVILHVKLMPL